MRLRSVSVGLVFILAVSFWAGAERLYGAFTLVEYGEGKAVIVVPDDPAGAESEAADELAKYVEEISGARLPVISAGEDLPQGLSPIRLGTAAADELLDLILEKGDDPESFALLAKGNSIDIRGLERPEGTRHGVYELLGNSHGSPLRPFEMDATKAVRAGGENVVTVRVSNIRLNEIGTGGLLGPAFFYAPERGDEAELDNIRPLAEEFPLYELDRLEQLIP